MFSKEARLFPGWYDVVGFVEQQSVTWIFSVQLFAHILCNRMFFALSNKYVPPCRVGCSQNRHVHARRVWCHLNCRRTERATWTFSVELIAHILSNIIFWIFDKNVCLRVVECYRSMHVHILDDMVPLDRGIL